MSNATIGALKRVAAALFAAIILATASVSVAFAAAPKAGSPTAAKAEATPEKIQELMTLLADPKVRDWLEKESKAEAAQARESDAAKEFDLARIRFPCRRNPRAHRCARRRASRSAQSDRDRAQPRLSDLGSRGRVKGLLLLAVFIGLGFGVEWLFRKATERIRRHLDEHPLETVNDRLRVVAIRFAFAVGRGGGLCPWQRRRLPRIRLAAAAARDGLRLPRCLSRDPRSDRRRPSVVGPPSRTIPRSFLWTRWRRASGAGVLPPLSACLPSVGWSSGCSPRSGSR